MVDEVETQTEMLKVLREKGYRITSQRRLVLEAISASDEHLDAEAIYGAAKEIDSGVSLTTVYRTLNLLKESGLIEQRFITREHDRERYEPLGAAEHYHFTCLRCRKVFEFQSAHVKHMRDELHKEHGVSVMHTCLCMEGYCEACSEELKDRTGGV